MLLQPGDRQQDFLSDARQINQNRGTAYINARIHCFMALANMTRNSSGTCIMHDSVNIRTTPFGCMP